MAGIQALFISENGGRGQFLTFNADVQTGIEVCFPTNWPQPTLACSASPIPIATQYTGKPVLRQSHLYLVHKASLLTMACTQHFLDTAECVSALGRNHGGASLVHSVTTYENKCQRTSTGKLPPIQNDARIPRKWSAMGLQTSLLWAQNLKCFRTTWTKVIWSPVQYVVTWLQHRRAIE